MVHFATVAAGLMAIFATNVAAQAPIGTECVQGRFYCGSNLLNNGETNALWLGRINAALAERGQPQDGTHQNDSLFFCTAPDRVSFDEYCIVPGQNRRCQNSNANACGNVGNDCCGPSGFRF